MTVRLVILASVVLLVVTLFYPLWRFELWAPQYPEGLFMEVWTHKLTGQVQNINILNHYIGMHPIEADEFAELFLFRPIIAALALLGVIAAVLPRKGIVVTWAVALTLFSLGALADFYIWEYRFGHELDPDAAIKVEGMAYQPPFIGSRTLLTITAKSYPATGGIAFSTAIVLANVALGLLLLKRRASA